MTSLQHGHFDPKFEVEGVVPIIFTWIVRPMNALQLCRWQFSHKHCSRLSSTEVRFYTEIGRFAFLSPLEGLRGNIRWSSKGHWKASNELPISANWTLFARSYGWGATSEYRFKIGDFVPTVAGWPKISGRKVRPTNHSSSQKTRLNDLSYGIKIWTHHSSALSRFTRLTDRRMDRRTNGWTDKILIARPRPHSMQHG